MNHSLRFGLSFMLLCLTSYLLAGNNDGKEPKGPCAVDIQKFCSEIKPGEGAIRKCLHEHKAELSAECVAHKESMKKEREKVHEACEADIERFCKGMEKGKGRIHHCLHKNKENLSEKCQSEIKQRHEMKPHKK